MNQNLQHFLTIKHQELKWSQENNKPVLTQVIKNSIKTVMEYYNVKPIENQLKLF